MTMSIEQARAHHARLALESFTPEQRALIAKLDGKPAASGAHVEGTTLVLDFMSEGVARLRVRELAAQGVQGPSVDETSVMSKTFRSSPTRRSR